MSSLVWVEHYSLRNALSKISETKDQYVTGFWMYFVQLRIAFSPASLVATHAPASPVFSPASLVATHAPAHAPGCTVRWIRNGGIKGAPASSVLPRCCPVASDAPASPDPDAPASPVLSPAVDVYDDSVFPAYGTSLFSAWDRVVHCRHVWPNRFCGSCVFLRLSANYDGTRPRIFF